MMFIGKDSDKVRAKGVEISANIIELVKTHLTPPPNPHTFTPEYKANMKAQAEARKARKLEKEEND